MFDQKIYINKMLRYEDAGEFFEPIALEFGIDFERTQNADRELYFNSPSEEVDLIGIVEKDNLVLKVSGTQNIKGVMTKVKSGHISGRLVCYGADDGEVLELGADPSKLLIEKYNFETLSKLEEVAGGIKNFALFRAKEWGFLPDEIIECQSIDELMKVVAETIARYTATSRKK